MGPNKGYKQAFFKTAYRSANSCEVPQLRLQMREEDSESLPVNGHPFRPDDAATARNSRGHCHIDDDRKVETGEIIKVLSIQIIFSPVIAFTSRPATPRSQATRC
jgi:hypothetical protein